MNPVGEGFTEVVEMGRVLRECVQFTNMEMQAEAGVGLGILSGGTLWMGT